MAASRKDAAVARVAARRYWRAADARIVVEAWRSSGEELGAFAGRYGIHPRRLRRWAGQRVGETGGSVVFHPVRLVAAAYRAPSIEPIEIVLGEGVRVRVPVGFCAEDLERVLGVLSQGTPC